jgi:hypothetical protein
MDWINEVNILDGVDESSMGVDVGVWLRVLSGS